MLEKIQRRATKLIKDLKDMPYPARLRRLKLPSLKFRRRRGDMITMYKLVTGKIKAEGLVQLGNNIHGTRGHSLRLRKQQARKLERRCHLPIRACNDWNGLPGSIVNATSVNAFKRSLDLHWQDQQFEAV